MLSDFYKRLINYILKEKEKMSITKRNFGIADGKEITLYTLTNAKGTLSAEIADFGGIVRSLVYDGTDVVLGRNSAEEYTHNSGYYGELIGRNSNRIYRSQFELNGKIYKLAANDGLNNLHGGNVGYGQRVWNAQPVDGDEPSLVLTLHSHDGDEGFPGNVDVKVTYTVTADDALVIHYEAQSDADTVINMTNHSYFNLNGHNSGTAENHKLTVYADFYTPNTDECMPYGEILSVSGTPFDLRCGKTLKEGFESGFAQIDMFGGYDHNFVLNGSGYRKVASAVGDKTGIIMDCYTDLPGVQLYSGNSIVEGEKCKDGASYRVHDAFCYETQMFPNATSYPFFPSIFVKKGEKYDTKTEYRFSK